MPKPPKQLSAATLCNLLGIGLALTLVIYQLWQSHHSLLANTNEKACGMATIASLFWGLLIWGTVRIRV